MKRFSLNLCTFVLTFSILATLLLAISSAPALGKEEGIATENGDNQTVKPDSSSPYLEGIQRLIKDTDGHAKISWNHATGVASFIRLPGDAALFNTGARSAEAQASAFFRDYGSAFGITDAGIELNLVNARTDDLELTHLTYQQVFKGVEVYAGVLKVHLDVQNRITAVNGTFIPDLTLNTTPTWQADAAANVALTILGQNKLISISTDVNADQSQLYIFRAGLGQGIPGRNHLVYEIEVTNPTGSIREFVYIDAHTGKVVEQITGIHEGLDRKVSETSLGNVVWQDSAGNPDPIPSGWAGGTTQQVTDWQNEIDGAAETYNLFSSMTNGAYLAYNSLDATMRTVNNDPGISCPNANWNGTSTNYCSDVTGDDTVAHEWGHAYTEYTNNLIYQWQSGALNESYSDIWGEVVDLLNGRGTDSPGGLRSTSGCSIYGNGTPSVDNTYRWLSGEDDPAFGGAIRDMWDPTCYGDPGKVTDTAQYVCSTTDSGGVHTNSGVPNHAFALMVDGGAYNGQTITGIGLTKAAHIQWQAQNMLTPASNFVDNANALEAACSALIGVNLNTLNTNISTTSPSGEIITVADCAEVAKVITAVEFRAEPTFCSFTTLLDPDAPSLCSVGESATTISLQDWEAGLGSWTVGTRNVANPSTFSTLDWAAVSTLPPGAPAASTQAAFVADLITGNCTTDDETGVLYLESPSIVIPGSAAMPRLAFDHWVATELGWDGGNLKISVNGGAFNLAPGSAYTFNPYNQTLNAAGAGNTNPMAGEAAFTGSDGGSAGGSWGQSQINLSSIAGAGDTIVLRYEFGVDGCNGVLGWYVDNVHTYACSTNTAPTISGLPDQTLAINTNSNDAIDLWAYASDDKDADSALTFTISNTPAISAGVTIDANRYIDINPSTDWSGTTNVTIQVEDSDSETNTDTFQVTVNDDYKIYLPVILNCWPLVANLDPISNGDNDGVYSLSWSWPSCASAPSQYELQADTDSGFGSPDSFTVSDTSFDAYSPTAGTYYWRVRAFIPGTGWSDWSNTQSTTVASLSHVWVENNTGQSLSVEIVGVEKKSFSSGTQYWRTVSPGTYTYKAKAWCGSGSWSKFFPAGQWVLSFYCSSSNPAVAPTILTTYVSHSTGEIQAFHNVR